MADTRSLSPSPGLASDSTPHSLSAGVAGHKAPVHPVFVHAVASRGPGASGQAVGAGSRGSVFDGAEDASLGDYPQLCFEGLLRTLTQASFAAYLGPSVAHVARALSAFGPSMDRNVACAEAVRVFKGLGLTTSKLVGMGVVNYMLHEIKTKPLAYNTEKALSRLAIEALVAAGVLPASSRESHTREMGTYLSRFITTHWAKLAAPAAPAASVAAPVAAPVAPVAAPVGALGDGSQSSRSRVVKVEAVSSVGSSSSPRLTGAGVASAESDGRPSGKGQKRRKEEKKQVKAEDDEDSAAASGTEVEDGADPTLEQFFTALRKLTMDQFVRLLDQLRYKTVCVYRTNAMVLKTTIGEIYDGLYDHVVRGRLDESSDIIKHEEYFRDHVWIASVVSSLYQMLVDFAASEEFVDAACEYGLIHHLAKPSILAEVRKQAEEKAEASKKKADKEAKEGKEGKSSTKASGKSKATAKSKSSGKTEEKKKKKPVQNLSYLFKKVLRIGKEKKSRSASDKEVAAVRNQIKIKRAECESDKSKIAQWRVSGNHQLVAQIPLFERMREERLAEIRTLEAQLKTMTAKDGTVKRGGAKAVPAVVAPDGDDSD